VLVGGWRWWPVEFGKFLLDGGAPLLRCHQLVRSFERCAEQATGLLGEGAVFAFGATALVEHGFDAVEVAFQPTNHVVAGVVSWVTTSPSSIANNPCWSILPASGWSRAHGGAIHAWSRSPGNVSAAARPQVRQHPVRVGG
jgi:hypothetical protein